jgi:hypothetical protein
VAQFKKPEEYANGPQPEVPQTSVEWQVWIDRLKVKLANLERTQGELETKKANLALDVEFGSKSAGGEMGALLTEITRGAVAAELARVALGRAHASLRQAQEREAGEREQERLRQIEELKRQLLEAAQQFDAAAIEMKRTLDLYFRVADDLHNKMTAGEQANFHDVRSSRGPSGALGHHRLARPLGLLGISGNPMHHQSLVSYLKPFCGPSSQQATPAPPQRETVTVEFKTEAEALSQPRPRS